MEVGQVMVPLPVGVPVREAREVMKEPEADADAEAEAEAEEDEEDLVVLWVLARESGRMLDEGCG